jgi:hypothetical protein
MMMIGSYGRAHYSGGQRKESTAGIKSRELMEENPTADGHRWT